MNKKIVVLGGGYAGVLTAKKLAKQAKKLKGDTATVTLIDKNPFHTMLTELHEVAAGRVDEESIRMDFKKIFAGRKVDFVLDTVTQIDYAQNKLVGENASYDYDCLVIGSGSRPAYFGTPGAEENSFSLWSYDDAIKLREQILACFRQAERAANKQMRRQLLSFFVVGGGFTGIEMMGELAEWIPILCKKFNVEKEEVTLTLCDMLARTLTSIPEKLAVKADNRLKKSGVKIMLNAKVCGVNKDSIEIEQNGTKNSYPSSTIIWTAGIEGSSIVQDSQIETVRGKRIETDEYLRSKQFNNVYVVGDNMYFIPEGEETAVPQMVENCEASAGCAAKNIMFDLFKVGKAEKYAPKFHGMMVCVGGRFGTAYVGTHKSKFGLPSFFAMFSKHFINVIYFVQVLGWHKVYDYLLHEILRVRDNRSFVGGHFSNTSPSFWLLPLRLFLGYNWIKEGTDKLPNIMDDFNKIFLFKIPGSDAVSSATTAVADAVSSATGQAGTAAEAVSQWGDALPVPEFLTKIVDWSMGVFIAPIAPYFQAFMVFSELVIGVLLIIGLFTSVTSIFSSMLCIMIYLSGMSNITILWYLFAAIALIGIGGTGHAFSLDYYVLPWLKKKWKSLKFVQKWYIYNE